MIEDLHYELALLRDLGFTHLDVKASAVKSEPAPGSRIADAAPHTRPKPAADPAALLAEMQSLASVCVKCRLSETRTQVVYGVGSSIASLMFIGEAPGRDEDLKGEPFVGRAGQLLTDIIKAMTLTRETVYIANVIKCRPPENRNPEPHELDACRPWIHQQIEIIQPKVIVTLGKFALQSLTGRTYAVSTARGQWQEFNGIRVMPTYHPAYLLRTPSAKKEVWADMKLVMAELGLG